MASPVIRQPVGFGARACAFLLDELWIAIWLVVVAAAAMVVEQLLPGRLPTLYADPLRAQVISFMLVTLPVGVAFAWSESRGATWGKRRLGLTVVGADGEAPGIARSCARTATKFLPWELAHTAVHRLPRGDAAPWVTGVLVTAWGLGFLYALSQALDVERRTLYDRASGTRVVR